MPCCDNSLADRQGVLESPYIAWVSSQKLQTCPTLRQDLISSSVVHATPQNKQSNHITHTYICTYITFQFTLSNLWRRTETWSFTRLATNNPHTGIHRSSSWPLARHNPCHRVGQKHNNSASTRMSYTFCKIFDKIQFKLFNSVHLCSLTVHWRRGEWLTVQSGTGFLWRVKYVWFVLAQGESCIALCECEFGINIQVCMCISLGWDL